MRMKSSEEIVNIDSERQRQPCNVWNVQVVYLLLMPFSTCIRGFSRNALYKCTILTLLT